MGKPEKILTRLLGVSGIWWLIGCHPLPVPAREDVLRAQQQWGTTVDSLQLVRGRELYRKKCGACHALFRPHQFTPQEWAGFVEDYADEAQLTEDEKRLIFWYVATMSTVDPATRKKKPSHRSRTGPGNRSTE